MKVIGRSNVRFQERVLIWVCYQWRIALVFVYIHPVVHILHGKASKLDFRFFELNTILNSFYSILKVTFSDKNNGYCNLKSGEVSKDMARSSIDYACGIIPDLLRGIRFCLILKYNEINLKWKWLKKITKSSGIQESGPKVATLMTACFNL